jgi:hypothetical protein
MVLSGEACAVVDDSGTNHADRRGLPQLSRAARGTGVRVIAPTTSFAGHPAHLPPHTARHPPATGGNHAPVHRTTPRSVKHLCKCSTCVTLRGTPERMIRAHR